MAGAASRAGNSACSNRQVLTHVIRESSEYVFRMSAEKLGLDLVYDVSHNLAKFEEHGEKGEKGEKKRLWVQPRICSRAQKKPWPRVSVPPAMEQAGSW
ncbi:MAG: RtcB family protein, partial [Thermoleophilia bacterium]